MSQAAAEQRHRSASHHPSAAALALLVVVLCSCCAATWREPFEHGGYVEVRKQGNHAACSDFRRASIG